MHIIHISGKELLILSSSSQEEAKKKETCPSNLQTVRIPKPIFSHPAFHLPVCSSLLKTGSRGVSLKPWYIPPHNFTNSSIISRVLNSSWIPYSDILSSLQPDPFHLCPARHPTPPSPTSHYANLTSATRCTGLGCGLMLVLGDVLASHLHPVALWDPASHDSANTFSVHGLSCALIIFWQTALEKVSYLTSPL